MVSSACCDRKCDDLEKLAKDQSKVLWIVLAINLTMFFVEIVTGFYARSLAVTGDSFDMLGDALTYGSSLYVINMGIASKARVAKLKAVIILISAVAIAAAAIYRTIAFDVPRIDFMGGVGILALAANIVCLVLLSRHRSDDINMSSVWICSRNDIIANVAVLAAAAFVFWLKSPLPDLVVGFALAILFVYSAFSIFRSVKVELSAKIT